MRMFAMMIILPGLAACGPFGGFAKEQGVVQIEAVPDSEIPTNGSIHVVKRGRFVIGPETHFCTYRPGFGLDGVILRDALKSIGQSDYLSGSPRTNGAFGPEIQSRDCINGNPVFIRGFQADNRTGKPYRLTLVVRQGDAFWQGVVERPFQPDCPPGMPISSDLMCNGKPYWNIDGDALSMSKVFAGELTGKEQ